MSKKEIVFCYIDPKKLHPGSGKEEGCHKEFYEKLEESVRKNGIIEPLLVINLPDRLLVKVGNSRLWTALKLELAEVPCIVVTLERDLGKSPKIPGRPVTNIHDEFKNPIHWSERENYIGMKCTHVHLDHEKVV